MERGGFEASTLIALIQNNANIADIQFSVKDITCKTVLEGFEYSNELEH